MSMHHFEIKEAMNNKYEAEQCFIENVNLALEQSSTLYDLSIAEIRLLFEDTLKRHVYNNYSLTLAKKTSLSRDELLRRQLKPRYKKSILERDKYRCTKCGSHKNLCVDHKTPISRGGDNQEDNLQTLCRSCNRTKGAKTMQEWLGDSL